MHDTGYAETCIRLILTSSITRGRKHVHKAVRDSLRFLRRGPCERQLGGRFVMQVKDPADGGVWKDLAGSLSRKNP